MSSPGSNSAASQRASEITSAMLNVPGYADDSMLFMMRYGALAKRESFDGFAASGLDGDGDGDGHD
ncbi:hypothetical protein TGAMA5MH_02987 [Trichoderma gamsii]|uniref:Uncharacterized protein n=1 Tax=Trichoderma gamsii TaxID=398673 RepID=A0A2K0TIC2_9HYPO|nr:hypothetical protein TGAMA5MH_02987 [Trichoderma gamsii]